MVTFADILDRWKALPRDGAGPVRNGIAMHEFKQWLTSADERAWFKACHALYRGEGASYCCKALEEILKCLQPFQRNMAQAHLDCARLSGRVNDAAFLTEIKSIARRRNLLEPFLLELVNEIREGKPRPTIASRVCVAFPLVWEEKRTVVLGRFNLEILSEDNSLHPANGYVIPAPEQSLFLEMHQDFQNTFSVAAEVISNSIRNNEKISLPDIRVSIELFVARPVPSTFSLTGKSGGAALAMGVAKCWLGLDQFRSINSPLRHLNLDTIAISAEFGADGSLKPVGGIHIKTLSTRESEAHEVNVLVVAKKQTGLPVTNTNEPGPKTLLLPSGDWIPESFVSGEELRSRESLLVVFAVNFFDAVDKLHRLQANTLLKVLEKPYLIAPYLIAGHKVFPVLMLVLVTASWYLLPAWWFLLIALLSFTAGILVVRSRILKIKHGAKFCLLPRTTTYSPATWSQMLATLETDQSGGFINISWLKSLIKQTSRERLSLKMLPWIWARNKWFWLRSLVLVVLLVLFSTPLQHCLAEHVFSGTANILGGESRRGDGNNAKYASFDSRCESGTCLTDATVGSYGLLRVQVEPKPRTARFLRVTSTSPNSYVKVDDNGPRQKEIVVPIVNDEARFYYGIDDNSPWEIVLEFEVLSYFGSILQKAQLVGYRAAPGE